MADYNLGLINLELMQKYEVHTNKQISIENEKLEKANELMGDIERFLIAFEKDQDDNGAVDWSQKPERIQLVVKLREQVKDDFPEMFPNSVDGANPNDVYMWNKDESKSLVKHVNNYVDTILQNKISQCSEHVLQHQQNSSKATEIFAMFVKRMNTYIEKILANIRQR